MGVRALIAFPEQVPLYSPPGHRNTLNRRLVPGPGREARNLEVVLGVIGPGGEAETHSHPTSEQVAFVLEGRALIEVGGEKAVAPAGALVYLPPGLEHRVTVMGDDPLKLLLVYSPPVSAGGAGT